MATGRGAGARPAAARSDVSAATCVVGVMGDPVAHSLSPLLHNTAFAELGLDWISVGFRVPAGRTAAALDGSQGPRGPGAVGDHAAQGRGGPAPCRDCHPWPVGWRPSTAWSTMDDGWRGENTDGAGLVAALRRRDRFDPRGRRCLVVGAGGAARAVIAALADAGAAEIVVVNRTPARATTALSLAGAVGRVGGPEDVPGCDLVVNATPVGMAEVGAPGATGTSPWPVEPSLLHEGQVVVDLVYHPAETAWMAAARAQGAAVSNGLGMLVHQAALQLAVWTGLDPPIEAMWRAVADPHGADGR